MSSKRNKNRLEVAEDTQRREYRDLLKHLERARRDTEDHLRRHLTAAGLADNRDVRVLSRVKRWDSLWAKVADGRCDRWDQCADLLGLKVVAVSNQEVEAARRAINQLSGKPLVQHLWHRSRGRSRGYSAMHGQLSLDFLPDPPAALTAFGAEIQLLTELQHAWDLVTHDEFYKATEGVPVRVRQRLFRIAGAIDLLDDEMHKARTELLSLRTQIMGEANETGGNPYLDEVAVLAFARSRWRTQLKAIQDKAKGLGFRKSDWDDVARCGPEMDSLLAACDDMKLVRVRDLDPYIEAAASEKWDAELMAVRDDYAARIATTGEASRLFNRPLTVLLIVLMFEDMDLSGPFLIPPLAAAVRNTRVVIANGNGTNIQENRA